MPRIYLDNSYYFLTVSTLFHESHFNTDEKRKIILDQIRIVKKNLEVPFYAWSIAFEHQHELFYLKNGRDLPKVVQYLTSGAAHKLNKLRGINSSVWDDYWIKVIVGEKMFSMVLGYIIGNFLKHNVVKNFEELKKTPFSSFGQTAAKYGDEFARELVQSVIELDFENIENFEESTLKCGK